MVLLVQTKLNFPQTQPALVARTRLIAKLNDGLGLDGSPSGKLFLFAAPAGFGKTSLVVEWLNHLPHGRFRLAWLSLDENDSDPTRFLAYLVAALQQACPELASAVPEMLHSPQTVAPTLALTCLINEIAEIHASILLVLDDYHVLNNSTIHQSISFLLENMPSNLRLIITSRSDPPFPLARLRARRELVEIRVDDLRFTATETAVLFRHILPLNLPPEDVAVLGQRTEGWITGLQLAALALQGIATPQAQRQFIQSFSGTHRYILDYLLEEVLARQPQDTLAFLQQTAVLDQLTASLCDAVTGRDDSQAMLEALARANFFLFPLDDARQWYRYHHLLADLLRARGQPDSRQNERHERAAAWYWANGLADEALAHYLKAGLPEKAAHLAEAQALPLLAQGQTATFRAWVDRLPPAAVAARPGLLVSLAWSQLVTGQIADAFDSLQRAEQVAIPEITGDIAAIQAYIAAFQGDTETAIDRAEQALALLAADNLNIRSVITFVLGSLRLQVGAFALAQQTFAEAASSGQAAQNRQVAVSAQCAVADMEVARGQLRQAEVTYQKALAQAQLAAGRPLPLAVEPATGLARLAYERNNLDRAAHWLDENEELIQQWHNPNTAVNHRLARFAIHLARAELAAAARAWEEASQIAGDHVLTPPTASRLAAARLHLLLVNGQTAAAWALAEQQGLTREQALGYVCEPEQIAVAHILLAQGRAEQTWQLLSRLAVMAQSDGRNGSLIKLLTLQAVAHQAQRQAEPAQNCLLQALSLAHPAGYVRTFLDEGQPLAELLAKLQAKDAGPLDYIHSLLQAFGEKGPSTPTLPSPQPIVEALTRRELEILRLLAAGLSNRAIATEMVITVGTVKTHVSRIMGKMGAANRTQAVARARELGLLP